MGGAGNDYDSEKDETGLNENKAEDIHSGGDPSSAVLAHSNLTAWHSVVVGRTKIDAAIADAAVVVVVVVPARRRLRRGIAREPVPAAPAPVPPEFSTGCASAGRFPRYLGVPTKEKN